MTEKTFTSESVADVITEMASGTSSSSESEQQRMRSNPTDFKSETPTRDRQSAGFESALGSAHIGLWEFVSSMNSHFVSSANFHFMDFNSVAREILGIETSGQIAFADFGKRVVPEDRSILETALVEQASKSGPISIDVRLQIQGESRWVRFSGRGLPSMGVVRAVGTVMEIETKHEGETSGSSRESNDRLRRLMGLTPALIAITNGPDHVCEYANPIAQILAGNRRLVGSSLRSEMAKLSTAIGESLDRVYATGEFSRALELPLNMNGSESVKP